MSLLSDGPHTIIVYPMVKTKNRYNAWELSKGAGITLEGVTVQNYGAGSLSGLESDDETAINDQKIVRGSLSEELPHWPGGTHSIVEWEGVEYDCKGLAKEYIQGIRTKHFMVRLKRRGAEVK